MRAIKSLLLGASMVALASAAHAAGCVTVGTTTTPPAAVNFLTGTADNQCNDADDLMLFIDKNATGPFTSIGGSLGKNVTTIDNVDTSTVGGAAVTDGSGFANFKSVNAGNTPAPNTLTEFIFNQGPSTTTGDGQAFPGFDGQLFRGQVDNQVGMTWNGDVTVTVNYAVGGSVSHVFTGLPTGSDFGVIGFDEVSNPSVIVSSVDVTAGAGGAFNQLKQLEFSVPGATAAIPEPSTWVMFIAGFGLLGLVSLGKKPARHAI